jgi:prepilin-type N-terminal cleavage/methylation domain-containing protein/prepilin-type processing-associated H-X9-DG protein
MNMHRHSTPCRSTFRGFTLVEIMVVVGIIALLMGLLVPAVGMVQASAKATKSQSNLRQWGLGTIAWANIHDERLPWEGLKDANDMGTNLAQPNYWANAIPPMVGQRPYSEISDRAFAEQRNVELSGDSESIFLDPSARPATEQPWGFGAPGEGGYRRQFYFNYVPNSQLNNTMMAQGNISDFSPDRTMGLAQIPFADKTVLMLEMRANPLELDASDVHYGRDLNRHRSDWKRFAARHFKGGHLMFADGHVAWMLNTEATTNQQGNRDPSFANGDWNTQKLIWDPLGPATDE